MARRRVGDADSDTHFAGLLSWSQDVRIAMRRMDPIQSRVMQMVYFERRSYAEVASELKMTRRTVAATMATGLQTLAIVMLSAQPD
ncbi:MAG: sigma factor-like helix-turn-helix DNA-binding protein [Jatrophihabitans sp.]